MLVCVSVLAHYPSWYASNLFKIDLGFCALVCRLAGRYEAGAQLGETGAFWTCATTPRCDARDRARLGRGHTIRRTDESLSVFLCGPRRGTRLQGDLVSDRRYSQGFQLSWVARDVEETVNRRRSTRDTWACPLSTARESSLFAGCLLLLAIYQEIVRPPSETDTLVAGAAVSKCLTTRSGVTTLGEFVTSGLCRWPSGPFSAARGRHWGSAVAFSNVLSHARGIQCRTLPAR